MAKFNSKYLYIDGNGNFIDPQFDERIRITKDKGPRIIDASSFRMQLVDMLLEADPEDILPIKRFIDLLDKQPTHCPPDCNPEKTVALFRGYNYDELVTITQLLREEGFTPDRLHELMEQLKNTFEYCWTHIKTDIQKGINGMEMVFSLDTKGFYEDYFQKEEGERQS